MSSYNELLALIDAYINQNGVQAITGQVLNGVLRAMVDQLGRGYAIMGAAQPNTDPGTPDAPESWFASTPGTYTNFDGLTVANAELALLSYSPTDQAWTKQTLTQGIVSTSASVDNNVGTPSVTSSYVNGVLTFTFQNLKGNPGQDGQDGDAAGFGTVSATVDGNVGTPGVSVQTSGPNTAKNMVFQFTNLKGETGVTSVVATVDNTSGSPACAVSLSAGVLTLAFTGLKGAQGDTGSSVDYPFTIVNNLTTNDATQALSAAMGVQLESEVSQLEADLTDLDKQINDVPTANYEEGKYVKANGVIQADATWGLSDFIPYTQGNDVEWKYGGLVAANACIQFYDSDKQPINNGYWSAGGTDGVKSITAVAINSYAGNGAYIRASFRLSTVDAYVKIGGTTAWTPAIGSPGIDYRLTDAEADIATLSSEIATVNGKIDKQTGWANSLQAGHLPQFPYAIYSGTFNNLATDTHIVIPISAGDRVFIKWGAYNLYIGFVKSYSMPSAGDTPDFCTGTSGILVNSNNLYYIAPNDANFLIVSTKWNGNATNPALVKINDYDVLGGAIGTLSNKAEKIIEYYQNPLCLWAGDIAELYIPEKLLSGISYVYFKNGGGSAQFLAYDSDSQVVWQARLYDTFANDIVYSVPCTVAGGNAVLGAIAGYVVFKDATHFNNNSSSSLNDSYKIDLSYNDLRFTPRTAYQINNSGANDVSIELPPRIYAVQDDNLQIFHRSVIRATDYRAYSIVVSCDYGKNYPRYYELKPTAAMVGTTKTLTYQLRNNLNEVVAQATTQLVIVAKPTTNATQKNFLVLGDSNYTSGTVTAELKRRLTASSGDGTPLNPTGLNLPNIAFVGRKEVAGIHQEASGGWGWRTFATNDVKTIRYQVTGVGQLNIDDTYRIDGVAQSTTYYMRIMEINLTEGVGNILCEVNGGYSYAEGDIPASGTLIKTSGNGDATIAYTSRAFENGNPLWNDDEDKIDFQNYSELYCGGVDIDAVLTSIGINDFRSKNDVDTKIESYVKPLLRAYHSDYPSGKFYFSSLEHLDIRGGIGAISGASVVFNWYNLSSVYWYALEKFVEITEDVEFSGYVKLVNIQAEFDCEHSYPSRQAQANNRTTETETLGTNNSHPVDDCRKELSDSFYRILCATMF